MKETLSQYVARIMRQKGLNHADVERQCNSQISASYVGRIERGDVTNITTDKMVALAEGLGVDPYEIFAASYGKPPASQNYADVLALLDTVQKLVMNPEVLEAVEQLLRLPPKEREGILLSLKRIDKPKKKDKKKED